MEMAKQEPDESFSFRWFTRTESDSRRSIDSGSFIEMDPADCISMRWTIDAANGGFAFDHNDNDNDDDDLPVAAEAHVHEAKPRDSSRSLLLSQPSSSLNSSVVVLHSPHEHDDDAPKIAKRCAKLKSSPAAAIRYLKKMLWRYLSFLVQVKSCTSARRIRTSSSSSSSVQWCRSDADISIYDAILHCKRSNGQEK
ncbi:hypothetical protein Cni_G15021 [Canna indica]|uniref:Membrane-associated kinase regulator 6 n=1 Tax=Canna indica TaxID=4628 RepID=A0AAQ3KDT1_9LILI|nr:hypothetical protein Cni_G15021 [Canna indica]